MKNDYSLDYIGYGTLYKTRELESNYMEPDYMGIKSHKRDHGISKNIKVIIKSHMFLLDMVEIVKTNFASFGLVYFYNNSLILIHEQIKNTEHYS